MTMSAQELDPRARRSRGIKRNIREEKAKARKTGREFASPPMPEYLSPEQRLDFERHILPRVRELPNADRLLIPNNLNIIEDWFATRERVRLGQETPDWNAKFDKRHPGIQDISKPDTLGSVLKPAFQLITGRFAQASNIRAQMRRLS